MPRQPVLWLSAHARAHHAPLLPGLVSCALLQRKRTLLPALADRHRTGTFVDRRFGESNPTLTPEEKMLERFTKEKQRASVRGGRADLFNLGDDDDEGQGLTHYGKSLGFDDFEGEGLGAGLDDDDESGQYRTSSCADRHPKCRHLRPVHLFASILQARSTGTPFSGTTLEALTTREMTRTRSACSARLTLLSARPRLTLSYLVVYQPERKKSKAEVMAEVMAKSKDHKVRPCCSMSRHNVSSTAHPS